MRRSRSRKRQRRRGVDRVVLRFAVAAAVGEHAWCGAFLARRARSRRRRRRGAPRGRRPPRGGGVRGRAQREIGLVGVLSAGAAWRDRGGVASLAASCMVRPRVPRGREVAVGGPVLPSQADGGGGSGGRGGPGPALEVLARPRALDGAPAVVVRERRESLERAAEPRGGGGARRGVVRIRGARRRAGSGAEAARLRGVARRAGPGDEMAALGDAVVRDARNAPRDGVLERGGGARAPTGRAPAPDAPQRAAATEVGGSEREAGGGAVGARGEVWVSEATRPAPTVDGASKRSRRSG